MNTISLYNNINNYQPIPIVKTSTVGKISNPHSIPTKKMGISYPAIYFTGKLGVKEPDIEPLSITSSKQLSKLYNNYKKDLMDTSLDDIQKSVDELTQTTEFSQKDILESMQVLTQFGNMRSITTIGKALDNENIGSLGYISKPSIFYNPKIPSSYENRFGLNGSLDYVMLQKSNYPLSGEEKGILLDNNTLDKLENLKKDKSIEFKKLMTSNTKFFIVSSIEDGISFLNRKKDLTTETKELLNKAKKLNISPRNAINHEKIERAKNLGITPIIIENMNKPTVKNIYNQLQPEQISKKELALVLDSTAKYYYPDSKEQRTACKDNLISYLTDNLDVYTPKKISKDLKQLHAIIQRKVNSFDKSENDTIYLIPKAKKSYDLIGYQYQLINNIPKEKFITINSSKECEQLDIKNKVVVIVDDCSLSGASLLYSENHSYKSLANKAKDCNANIIFAPLLLSPEAKSKINKRIDMQNRTGKDCIVSINETKFGDDIDAQNIYLAEKALGEEGWELSNYCIIFPYMCPDNNTEFAANIGLFHNINYRNNNELNNGINNLTNIKTLHKTASLIAQNVTDILSKKAAGEKC